jgi:hypothetical protein
MNTPQPGHIGWSPDYQSAHPITSKSDEIAGLRRQVADLTSKLHKSLDLTVTLSTRNSELRAAIHSTIYENPNLAGSWAMSHLVGAVETQTGEGK